MNKLLEPEDYLDDLREAIKRHKEFYGGPCLYTKDWRLRIDKKTNAHRNCDGSRWGWYEIYPLGRTIGYWSEEHGRYKDDLSGIDIEAWNKKAEEYR